MIRISYTHVCALSMGCRWYGPQYGLSVAKKFPDAFPEELSGLPPDREVEFAIDFLLGIAHISKTPCRMAPAEMKKLKIQF